MKHELLEQRLGTLRQAIISTRDNLRQYAGFEHLANELERVLKADDRLAEQGPHSTGEQLKELAASHRETAIKLHLRMVFGEGIPDQRHYEFTRDFVDEIIAAAGYEASCRARYWAEKET